MVLAMLRVPAAAPGPVRSLAKDLREGWAQFRSHRWLVATTVQFTLFSLLTWGPFLCRGPVLATEYLGGAGAWGAGRRFPAC